VDNGTLDYQERIVAFIDVLGFSALVKASGSDPEAQAKIRELIGTNELFDQFMKLLPLATATFFSDCFVVSMGRTDQVLFMVREVGYLCKRLLLQGLPCRGAITVGPLHHHDRTVVGPAFVDAYHMERSVAIYPRVILDDAAMEQWRFEFRVDEDGSKGAHPHLATLVKRDRDGQHFIDIFNPELGSRNFIPWTSVVEAPVPEPTDDADFLVKADQQIRLGIEANAGDPRIRAKYEWLASECREHGLATNGTTRQ
jgi:hypothetical protein